ncbi:MAG: alpha/beta fold hydrolase [Candidatus Rokuibacteriota bacterium]
MNRWLRRIGLVLGVAVLAAAGVAVWEDEPMKARTRPAWLTAELYPFEDRWLDIDGHAVHYVDEGRGPVLLLLHGNPTWSFLYRNIIQALSGSYRCIAIDYPGFGLSIAKEGYDFTPRAHSQVVESLALALDLKDMTLMVQDWGGPIGLGFAGRHPERVRALVIGNTWAWPVNGDPRFERFSGLMGGAVGRFFIRNYNAFVNLLIPLGTARSLSRDEMRAYRAPFPTRASRRPTAIFPREIIASREYLAEVEAHLPRLADKPALIVWGAKDPAFREPERVRFEQLFRHHRTVVLENARHFIQEDAAARIAQEIRAFGRRGE